MKNIIICLLAVLPITFSYAGTYSIDKAHSSVEFKIKHLAISSVKGRFKNFTGTFDYDEKTKKLSNVVGKVDTETVDTNEEDRDAHLQGPDFFGVKDKTYNTVESNRWMTFKSTKIEHNSKGPTVIHGRLTIKNKSKDIKLEVDFNGAMKMGAKTHVGMTAEGTIDRRYFGLTWQKASSGALQKVGGFFVGNDVKIILEIQAKSK
jgi:polyisoprenoid-binding protein YceI